jgi:predicted CxxxxCH...CXXCH cytochrome family protein
MLAALLGMPSGGQAAHDMNWDCYVCHNIKGGAVWQNSYSISSAKKIGMNPYSRPITCDICHTDYGTKFGSTSVSKHPVRIIVLDNTQADNNPYGSSPSFVDCRDCHSGNQTTPLTAPLDPDVSPLNYSGLAGNGVSDGYPNHDNTITGYTITPAAWGAGNVVTPGTEPHLGSSYAPTAVYNKVPSNVPLTDYALCFSCHDGTAGRTNRRVDVKTKYSTGKGHYYKYGTPTGGTNGNKMPCSDCHASHNAANNSRLYVSPKGTTGGLLDFADPASPTAAEIRFLCMDCHDDYGTPTNGTPLVRGVEPPTRKTGIAGHAGADTQSCKQCHDPHDTPGGGPDCLSCHTAGGAAGTTYDYIDAMFKGVGSDNTATQPASSGSLTWSQHGGFVSVGGAPRFLYTSPYNTKATNDCFKCHGDRHNNTYALIDADNTDSYAYNTALGMDDNTAAGITNANNFCLTCHDGNGTAADVQIGNTAPPNVATNYVTGGHGRPLASGAYTVSLNNPAYLKCTDCHEVHGSNHNKLLPAKKNEVAANFTIPSNFPEKTFRSGGSALLASTIDFTDYSSPASGKGFGTTGDPGDQHAPAGATTGFCDACHKFAGRANRGTDNVTNKAHTHEGLVGEPNQTSPSQMTFTKDCLECHDTHGTTNLEMVDTTINAQAVTFTARTNASSFDPVEAGSTVNVNSVCVVCHQNPTESPALNVDHNYRTSIVNPDHNEGTNCTSCHPHGVTSDAKKFGFPQAACNSCHGAASDTAGMPAFGDTGTYHADTNNVIGTRAGDNTVHKIHVNYLVGKRGVARSFACYVCHVGGGSGESGGHPGNPTNKTFKTGTQPTAVPYLQVALDNTGAVVNVWNGAGTGPSYSGTPGTAADNTNGWKTCSNTNCHYALSPSWSGKQQITAPPGTMTVSTPDALPAAGSVGQGTTNNVVDKIRLQTDASGMVTDNQFKVRLLAGSTAQNGTDIAKVAFWEDVDNDNTVSAGDVQIGGSAVFSATDNGYTVGPVSYNVAASTTKQILVAVDLAAGAVNGRTMTFSTVNGDIKATYGSITAWTTFNSNQFTAAAPGTLTVSTPDALPAAGPVMVGSGNNLLDKINLAATGGYALVTGLKVKELGTAQNGTDIANITFWRDVNANGTLEPGTDTILGGAATFNAADNTYSVTGLSLNVSSGATERILVVDNVAAGATTTRTIQTQVVDGTYVTLSAGTVAGTFPITASTIQTISSGGQLTVTTPDALPALGDIRGGSDGNVVDKILLTAASADVVVSGLWVKELGTSVDVSDIASVSFVDNTGGANTPLGTATFNAGDNTYRLTGLGLTVAVGTPRTILVTANIANGATAARTVQTQVLDSTYVQVSAGTVNAITSFSSTVQTIRALTAVIVTDTAGSTTPVTTTNVSASGTHQFYATATYSNAALNQDVTTASAWSRAGTATGSTVGAATGLYTAGTTAGTDNVAATYRGQSDNTTVNVSTAVAFPATTYIVNINNTTALGWVTTNMTTGTAKYGKNDNTTLVKSGQVTTSTYYGTTTAVTDNIAFTAVWNTAVPAGNNLTITGVTFRVNGRKGATADRIRLMLLYFNPSGGAETVIYDTGMINPSTWPTATPTTGFTHDNQSITPVAVPDGMKLGFRLRYNQTSATAMRLYVASTSGQTGNDNVTLYGTNSTGVAPAPPRTTGDTTAIACNTCHQFAPDDATAGYKDSNQYYYALPGSHAAHGVALVGGTNPANSAALDTCTVCHPAAADTYGSDHMSGTVNTRTGSIGTRTAGPAYADDGTFDNVTRTCSNVYCHAGRPTPQATGKSWGYGTAACGTCHAVTPPYGKHALHNNGNVATTPTETSTAGNYDFSCYYCHPSGTAHVNYPVSSFQAAQVAFSGTLGDNTLSGTYTPGVTTAGWDNVTSQGLSWTNGSCATYCHTNGRGGSALVTPTWNHAGFPTATCLGCHDTRGALTTLSTRHRKHTDNTAVTGYNYSCDECHAATVANDSWTALHATTGRPNHVDGLLTVQFGTSLRATAVAISGTYTQGVDECGSTYCHSDGSSIKNSGTIQANSIRWDNTTTPLPCNSCHGVGGPTTGAPNYTTSGTRRNSHPAHASVTCQTCHSQTTTTGTTITTPSNHINGTYQVSGTGFTYSNAAMLTTGSTCAFTAGCHSGTVTWGVPLTGGCFACHTGSEVANKPLESVDGVANPVDNTQYNSYGHGNSTTFTWDSIAGPAFLYGNTGAPNNGCYECHSSGASHVPKSATDPYRLGAWASNVDGLCNDCHGPSAANANRAVNSLNLGVLGHNKVNTGSVRTWPGNYDYKCVDCHDPHGDGNYFLIRSAVNNPANSTDTNTGSNSYGTPKDNALSAITFTSLAGFGPASYAISGTADGICEVCHNQTTLFNATGSDNAGTHASRTGRCTSCHGHTVGFKGAGHAAGSGCKGCHNAAQAARRAIQPDFDTTAQHAGTWAAIASADCELCHLELSQDSAVILKQWTGAATYTSVTYAPATLYTMNAFCLSCHGGAAYSKSFSVGGAPKDVGQYWQGTTSLSHNYAPATYNTLPQVTKARSPHGFPGTNQLKQEAWTTAVNQTKYTDLAPVACLECHPAHGSNTVSPAKLKGAAFSDGMTGGKMINAAEPTLCWTCHDTSTVGVKDYWGDSTTAGTHWTGNRLSPYFTYKQRAYASTHLVNDTAQPIACSICHNPHGASNAGQYNSPMLRASWMTSPYKEDRMGWLSGTARTTQTYLTKLTLSRYGPRGSSDFAYNNPKGRGNGFDNSTGVGHDGYFIDENTFGITGSMTSQAWTTTPITASHFTESDNSFAGLCATCHTDATWTGSGGMATMKTWLTTGITALGRGQTSWGAAIHNTVRGWAGSGATSDVLNPTNNPDMHGYSAAGSRTCMAYVSGCSSGWAPWWYYNWQGIPNTANQMSGANAVHQFPCSKCHTPHASELPKLMTTNCIDVGTSTTSRKLHGTQAAWTYPTIAGTTIGASNGAVAVLCHNQQKTNTTGGGGWNKVTGW